MTKALCAVHWRSCCWMSISHTKALALRVWQSQETDAISCDVTCWQPSSSSLVNSCSSDAKPSGQGWRRGGGRKRRSEMKQSVALHPGCVEPALSRCSTITPADTARACIQHGAAQVSSEQFIPVQISLDQFRNIALTLPISFICPLVALQILYGQSALLHSLRTSIYFQNECMLKWML